MAQFVLTGIKKIISNDDALCHEINFLLYLWGYYTDFHSHEKQYQFSSNK